MTEENDTNATFAMPNTLWVFEFAHLIMFLGLKPLHREECSPQQLPS
jgi:hypothetical protein